MKHAVRTKAQTVNAAAGKLYFRVLGTLTGSALIAAAWMAWQAFAAAEVIGGLLLSAFAALMALFTRYCWSPKRRLTDIDP